MTIHASNITCSNCQHVLGCHQNLLFCQEEQSMVSAPFSPLFTLFGCGVFSPAFLCNRVHLLHISGMAVSERWTGQSSRLFNDLNRSLSGIGPLPLHAHTGWVLMTSPENLAVASSRIFPDRNPMNSTPLVTQNQFKRAV